MIIIIVVLYYFCVYKKKGMVYEFVYISIQWYSTVILFCFQQNIRVTVYMMNMIQKNDIKCCKTLLLSSNNFWGAVSKYIVRCKIVVNRSSNIWQFHKEHLILMICKCLRENKPISNIKHFHLNSIMHQSKAFSLNYL